MINSKLNIEDLINLSCVSRAFSDLALDAAWYKMEGISPILSLLSVDGYEVEEGLDDLGKKVVRVVSTRLANLACSMFTLGLVQTSHRTLCPEDLFVFKKYAHRVKILKIYIDSDVEDHQEKIIRELGALQTPVLPCLQALALKGPKALNLGSFFLVPSITRISYEDMDDFIDLRSHPFLPSLPSSLPNLRSFAIWGDNDPLFPSRLIIPHMIPLLRRLKTFALCDGEMDDVLLHCLSTCEQLTTLTCSLPSSPTPLELKTGAFPSLKAIRLRGHIDRMLQVSRSVTACHVQELGLRCITYPSPLDTISELIVVVATRFSASLRKFNLNCLWVQSSVDFGQVTPLFTCQSLVDVKLKVKNQFDDGNILQLAQSWPMLQSFTIKSPQTPAPRLLLVALCHLANNCPHIEEIAISVDATNFPDVVDVTPSRLGCFNLS